MRKPLDKLGRAGSHPAFALNGLDKKASGLIVDQGQRAFEIVEVRIFKTGQQRRKSIAHLGLIGRRNRPQRTAVKGVFEGDQLVPMRIAIRHQ